MDDRVSGKTVLVADDSAAQRRFLQLLLGLDGHRVVAVDGGREALERVAAETPDLIVLDVNMRDSDGVAICDALRRKPELAGVPVVILTGSEAIDLPERAREARADVLVRKPLLGKDFRGLIGSLLGRAESQPFAVR